MNSYQRALRDFQDYADDVTRARYRTFEDAIRRFASSLAPTTVLGEVVAQLPPVDFDTWYQLQQATVQPMVGSGRLAWPDDARERLAMQVGLVRGLAAGHPDILEFTHHFTWTRNDFDDNVAEFVQQVFRPFTRDFLRVAHDTPAFAAGLRGAAAPSPDNGAPVADEVTLFISHAGADASTAKALVILFEKALKISARRIRCTSVDGYRLPAGADTNEQLRTEVFGARLLVAVLTPASLASQYVLFELGARWGAKRPLFPVLAGGARARDLRAPLSGLNALDLAAVDQVRQLVEDVSGALATPLEPMASFSAQVDAVVTAASALEPPGPQQPSGPSVVPSDAAADQQLEADNGWRHVDVDGKRYAWDGPLEDLKESFGVPLPEALIARLQEEGLRPTTGIPGHLWNEFSKGYQQVWFIDAHRYKHAVVSRDTQVLLIKPIQ